MDWNVSSLLWLLGTGALFYWMMKSGGCGMHGSHSRGSGEHGAHDHGGGESGGAPETSAPTFRDPVCGMPVAPERAAGMRTVQGRNFFLCSSACLEKFDKTPDQYAEQARKAALTESTSKAGRQRHAGCH